MFPDRKTALQELAKAEELNPGPWGQHSRNVAHAAELIAGRCDKMDSDKAFVCGLLHDIGRRTGWPLSGTSSTDTITPPRGDGTRSQGSV
ncbi:MAG: HDOD domain-containing protein [Ruthenibacterium lactatiformans]